jgi:hypothetical protein
MQPVHAHILTLLYNSTENRKGKLNVNTIFNELVAQKIIKRNKKLIIDAIHFLEKCEFIETVMQGKQKEIKMLTQIGNDLAKLIVDLDQYKNNCSALLEEVRNLRGTWDVDNTEIADFISPYEVTNMMFIRYLSILHKIKNNVNAKSILNEIIINKINDQLSTTINDPPNSQDSNSNLGLITEKIDDINSRISGLYGGRIYSKVQSAEFRDHNAFGKLRVEVENVLSSIIEVLELPNMPLNDINEIILPLKNTSYHGRNPFAISQFGQVCQRYLLKKIKKEYGLSNLDGYLGLRWTYIVQSTIPLQVQQGMTLTVPVEIFGNVRQTSIKLLIVDPNNKKFWHAGTIKGNQTSQLIINMPPDCKVGQYRALILLYGHELMGEDGRILTTKEGMIIDFDEKIFEVVTNMNEGRTVEK